MEYSSGMIKPDGVARNLQCEIFNWMESIGLRVIFQREIELNKEDVRVLYNYCYGMDHYSALEGFMTSGPVIFYVVSSDKDTVESLNRLVGSTDPAKSTKETIRGRYGESIAKNVIHSTQTSDTFITEIEHFLTKREIIKLFVRC